MYQPKKQYSSTYPNSAYQQPQAWIRPTMNISPRLQTERQRVNEKIRQQIIQQIRYPQPQPQNQNATNINAVRPSGNLATFPCRTEKRSRFNNADDEDLSPTKRKKPSVATVIASTSQNMQHTPLMPDQNSLKWLDNDGNSHISQPIRDFFNSQLQTNSTYGEKLQLRQKMYEVLINIFPYCGLYIVGSSITGFSTNNSDMDLCLMLTFDKVDQRKEAVNILFLIQKTLRRCSFISYANVIRARVPILKIKDKGNIDSDLNINNSVGIRNTHLLKHYSIMDERVRPLVLFVKKWAQFHDINDASKMTISSYSLTLMVIHFLQCGCSPPVLPCLQKLYSKKFSNTTDVRELRPNENLDKFTSSNFETVGSLFLGYLRYYTTEFNYEENIISVRTASVVPLHASNSATTQPNDWKYLMIEEPFDLTNTARSVFDKFTFDRIRRVFRQSYQTLTRRRNATDLFKYPF